MSDAGVFEEQEEIPYQPQLASQDATIASLRWEGQQLIAELYRVLGGYEFVEKDGRIVPQKRNEMAKSMMNDQGIEAMVSILQSKVNPVFALTNIDDEEANRIIRQTCYMLMRHLVYNQKRYGIDDGDMGIVMDNLKGLVFAQIKRAVGGHESKNFRTQTFEQNQSVSQEMRGRNRSIIPTFGRN